MRALEKKTGFIKLQLILIMCLGSIGLGSQVPGYMGKKLAVGYGFYGNPALSAFTLGYGENPLNILHEGFIEYVTGKKFALGFSGRFYKSSYLNTSTVDIERTHNIDQREDHPSGSYEIRGSNFMLYGKAFLNSYLAPWGKYFVFGLSLHRYTTSYNPADMKVQVEQYISYNNTRRYYFSDFGATTQSYNYVDLLIGRGKTRIIADGRVVIDYGYNLNVVATTLTILDAFDRIYLTPDEYIAKTSISRVRGINRFNLFIKAAFLF